MKSVTNEVDDTRAAVKSASQRPTPLEGERRPGPREIDRPSGDDSWGELYPLDDPTVPEFPVETLPVWVQDFVGDVSKAMGNPPDLAAMAVLGILSSAVSKKAEVRVNDSHWEKLALYLCCVSPPGDGKSPTLKMVAAPLRAWEEGQRANQAEAVEAEQADFDSCEAERRYLTKAVSEADEGQPKEKLRLRLRECAEGLAGRRRPELPRFLADDFTPPAMGILLERNHGRMCVLTDEGNELFQILAGKHSANGGTEATLFKKAWSGESVNTDRIGREGVRLEAPLLNVNVAIQPDALRNMTGRSELIGLGVLDRILFALPESCMTPPDAPAVPASSRNEYAQGVTRLLSIPLDFTDGSDLEPDPSPLHLDAGANQVRIAFNTEVNAMAEDGGALSALRGWGSKLKANVLRTAGVLHLADHRGSGGLELPITEDVMLRAVTIAHYWIAHARKAFDLMEVDQQTLATRKVWRWIKRRASESSLKPEAAFRKQEIWQGVKGNRGSIQTVAELNAALEQLCESNYIRLISERPEIYEVNPRALD